MLDACTCLGTFTLRERACPILCLQDAESLDGSGQQFLRDRWDRNADDANAGYGITAVLEGGDLLEKASISQKRWPHSSHGVIRSPLPLVMEDSKYSVVERQERQVDEVGAPK